MVIEGAKLDNLLLLSSLMNLRVSRILNFNRPMYDVLIILNKK